MLGNKCSISLRTGVCVIFEMSCGSVRCQQPATYMHLRKGVAAVPIPKDNWEVGRTQGKASSSRLGVDRLCSRSSAAFLRPMLSELHFGPRRPEISRQERESLCERAAAQVLYAFCDNFPVHLRAICSGSAFILATRSWPAVIVDQAHAARICCHALVRPFYGGHCQGVALLLQEQNTHARSPETSH